MAERGRQRPWRDKAHPATVRANHVKGGRHHPGGVGVNHAGPRVLAQAAPACAVAHAAGATPRRPSYARPRPTGAMDQEKPRHR